MFKEFLEKIAARYDLIIKDWNQELLKAESTSRPVGGSRYTVVLRLNQSQLRVLRQVCPECSSLENIMITATNWAKSTKRIMPCTGLGEATLNGCDLKISFTALPVLELFLELLFSEPQY